MAEAEPTPTVAPSRFTRVSSLADRAGKIVGLVLALATLFSTAMWWRLDARLKHAGLTEAELKTAQFRPNFSVQYMIFGGAVFDDVKSGKTAKADATVRRGAEAKAAYESLWTFPLVDTKLERHAHSDQIDAFLKRWFDPTMRPRDGMDAVKYTVLAITAAGGTRAVDVELECEERVLAAAPFLFPPEGWRYVDSTAQYQPGAPVMADTLPYRRRLLVLKLGDIAPGSGRLIPVRIGYVAEDVESGSGESSNVDVIASYHLKPVKLRFRTVSGETIEQPIREQLDIPMPVSDYIDIRG